MAKRGIYVTGVNALSEKLKKNATMDDVKRVVKTNTVELEKTMKQKAQFKGHYDGNGNFVSPTGMTRRSITTRIAASGMLGKVGPHTEYAPYLEFSTRFMSAQPFVGPSYRLIRKQFLNDMERLVK